MIHLNNDTQYYPLLGQLKVNEETVSMTHREIMLLDLLLKHKNKIVTKEIIQQLVYQDEILTDASYKSSIYRLRKKIGKDSITSLSGLGIKLNIEHI